MKTKIYKCFIYIDILELYFNDWICFSFGEQYHPWVTLMYITIDVLMWPVVA